MLQGLLLIFIAIGFACLLALPVAIIMWFVIKRNVKKQWEEQEEGTFKLD